MALSHQESDFITRMAALSNQILDLQNQIQLEIGQYNALQYSSALLSDDIDDVFPTLDHDIVVSWVTGIIAVDTTIGDMVSGHASNFIKARGSIS